MPSVLDRRMDAALGKLVGPGAPLAVGSVTVAGVEMPLITGVPQTLPPYFAQYCNEHAGKTFLVAGPERLTFAEVHAAAHGVATALVGTHGVKPGDRIGIAMRNSPSWIVLYMGIVMAGGIATLLNGWWQSEELAAAMAHVECSLVFADPPRAKRLAAIPALETKVVTIDDVQPIATALAGLAAAEATLPAIAPTDPATILFTSGSTGQSKGAISEHRAVTQAVYNYLVQALMMLDITTQDGATPPVQHATLLNIPLFHVTAEVPVFLQSFAMGRKLVLMPKWDAEEAMRLIQAETVTYFVGVPLMSFEMLTHPKRANYDLSAVTDIAAGGAPRPVEHVRRLAEEMGGPKPLMGYGLTETNAAGCGNFRDNYLAKPNSTGRASLPLIDLAILDDHGQKVPQGERGEIAIRSVLNFTEYYGRPDATATAFTPDRYFLTGDIGYLDEDGYLFIVDRKKDIIIRGGENISCQEVEAALYLHPAVAEAAVFGLADERYGEVPGAVVLLREGETLTPADLCAFLSAHIAAFKVPARIWIADRALTRLGTEKIDKVSLRAKYRAIAAAETVAA